MLAPPRLSYRLAFVAILLFFVLFLYHTSGNQEFWMSPTAPQPPPAVKGENGPSRTVATQSLIPTQTNQEGNMLSTLPVPEPPEHRPTQNVPTDTTTETAPTTVPADAVDGVIVMGKLQEEYTEWVSEKLPKWKNAIYVVDNQSAPLHTPMNKGREATPYLTYIIDNYHDLPKTLIFLHSHENGYPGGWHTDTPDHSNVWSVENLNIDHVQRTGYVNLRCTHIPGCPDEIQPFRDPYDPSRSSENHMAETWQILFGNPDVPHVIGAACCAQFAVSRDQVLKRPLDDYIRFRAWVLDTPLEDDLSGRIMEYLWHVIFGKPPVDCPAQDQCFWDVYHMETHFDEENLRD